MKNWRENNQLFLKEKTSPKTTYKKSVDPAKPILNIANSLGWVQTERWNREEWKILELKDV